MTREVGKLKGVRKERAKETAGRELRSEKEVVHEERARGELKAQEVPGKKKGRKEKDKKKDSLVI